MSLESIVSRIIQEADQEKERILLQARRQAEEIVENARREADALYREILEKEKRLASAEKQKTIVQARLERKKGLLAAKQELIGALFQQLRPELKTRELRKQQISAGQVQEVAQEPEFYFNAMRLEHEAEIAQLLFS